MWIIPIIGYLTKKHKELYKAVIAPAFVIIGYTLIIRCSGNLNANMYITVLEKEIWIPFCFIRALAGMSCGTLAWMIYDRLKLYKFTKRGEQLGRWGSILILVFTIWLSYRPKDVKINSYGWRALIVIFFYAVSILLAFLFGDTHKSRCNFCNKVLIILGRMSLSIYMVHTLVIYIMKNVLDVTCYSRQLLMIFLGGTVVLCIVFEFCLMFGHKIGKSITRYVKSFFFEIDL